METKILWIAFILVMIISSAKSRAQDTSSVTKRPSVKTIWDIPHKTLRQKWMWTHRCIAY